MEVAAQLGWVVRATRAMRERLATRTVPFEGGTAFLDDEFPIRYDANYLLVDAPAARLDAAGLDGAAEEILGGAGREHREVVVPHDGAGMRLAAALGELDYRAEHTVVMLHEGSAPSALPGIVVEEVPFERVRPFLIEVGRRAPWFRGDDALAETLADYHGKLERTIDCTFLAAQVDGRIASACELYLQDGVAQVEDVNTLEEHRGRGLATACVTRAVAIGRDRGARVVFIEADVDDWPQRLYRRLGFEDATRSWSFVRWPAEHAARTT